jgi:hypothetical protein
MQKRGGEFDKGRKKIKNLVHLEKIGLIKFKASK